MVGLYYETFERHYRKIVEVLPTSAMWDYLVSGGLLRDTTLRQKMLADQTDYGKARLLLDSMRGGLSCGVNETFMSFLEVMKDYGRKANNPAVTKVAEDIIKDLPVNGNK